MKQARDVIAKTLWEKCPPPSSLYGCTLNAEIILAALDAAGYLVVHLDEAGTQRFLAECGMRKIERGSKEKDA